MKRKPSARRVMCAAVAATWRRLRRALRRLVRALRRMTTPEVHALHTRPSALKSKVTQVTNKKLQMSNAEIREQGEKFAEALNHIFQGMPNAVIAYGIVRVVNASPGLTREVNHYTLQAFEARAAEAREFEKYGPPRGTA